MSSTSVTDTLVIVLAGVLLKKQGNGCKKKLFGLFSWILIGGMCSGKLNHFHIRSDNSVITWAGASGLGALRENDFTECIPV
jgi:hypothetical protein